MQLDYERDKLLPDFSVRTLNDRYLLENETSPQQAFARAAKTFADDDDHAQRLYDYASQLWFMFSTPVLSNGHSANYNLSNSNAAASAGAQKIYFANDRA